MHVQTVFLNVGRSSRKIAVWVRVGFLNHHNHPYPCPISAAHLQLVWSICRTNERALLSQGMGGDLASPRTGADGDAGGAVLTVRW